jgi:hypothetical protein
MPTIRAIAGALGILSILVTGTLSTGCNRGREPSTGDKVAAAAANRLDRARKERTLGKLEALRTVLTRYAIDHDGALPEGSSLAGVSAELAPRYMPLLESEDAWGNIMSYASDGKTYSVVSSGPDGVSGTADDITLRDGAVSGGS